MKTYIDIVWKIWSRCSAAITNRTQITDVLHVRYVQLWSPPPYVHFSESTWTLYSVSHDIHPHHASPYFSGALRWKSISFAKQSGRLPQHRGVMESDGWPPYKEPWDKA